MIKQKYSYHIVLRYTLFQLPGLAVLILILILLHSWFNIPTWLLWTAITAWIAKDVIMFPFVWRAYDKFSPDVLVGSQGKAIERLAPTGYIMIKGELWRAQTINDSSPIEKGDTVTVSDTKGLTLLVQPQDKSN